MADPRNHPEQEEEHDGASPSELLIEACRRNNTELLQETIDSLGSPEKAAAVLNSTKTVMGNYVYHEAALAGNYEVIDMLLDQEGFECDPVSTRDRDTPLHSAIRWINSSGPDAWEYGLSLVQMMLEAGSDPRIKNKANLTPYDLTDPANKELRRALEDAVYDMLNKGDFVEETLDGGEEVEGEDEESDAGSASDEEEAAEYRRMKAGQQS